MMDLDKIKEKVKDLDAFTNYCGLKLVDMTLGKAIVESKAVDEFPSKNFMGNVHGGYIFTMADVAGGLAVASYGERCVTIDCHVNFIKGIGIGKLTAEGQVVHKGKSTAVAKVEVYNERRQLIATSTNTMFLLGQPIK